MSNPEPVPGYSVTPQEAVARLDGVRFASAGAVPLCLALPARHKRRRRYPLLLLLDPGGMLGSAIELSRLMAQTRELREAIVLGLDCAADPAATVARVREALRWCTAHYRLRLAADGAVFGAGAAAAHAMAVLQAGLPGLGGGMVSTAGDDASAPRLLLYPPGQALRTLESHAAPGWPVPDLVSGLRVLWGSGRKPGKGYDLLGLPGVRPLLLALSLPLRALKKLRGTPPPADPRHRLCSAIMRRDFELFVSLPPSYTADRARAYPLLLVLDANLEFAAAAEAAAALARAGAIGEVVVAGIGGPRAEGMAEFAFRRFEEFSPPPAQGYRYQDGMGRIMRSLFALRGQDARTRMGRAPLFHRFLCEEALPLLRRHYRIDAERLALLGHSAGGAFACYALLQADAPFAAYAGISPGIGMSGFWLRQQLEAGAAPAPRARRVVLSIGAEEGEEVGAGSGIAETAAFARRLRENGGVGVSYHCYGGESHASTYARAVVRALGEVFGG